MIVVLFAFLLLISSGNVTLAQTIDHDSFEVGVEAYNAGNCQEALRIMKQYEKEQPSAAYVVRACSLILSSEKKTGISYDVFIRKLNGGDLKNFDNLGMIARFYGEIKGLSGSQYLNSLIAEANRGNTDALFQLGLLYQEGKGVPRNFHQAATLFEKAAEAGHTEAMNSAGLYRRFGLGVEKDKKKANDLWSRAALKKNTYALYNLGQMSFENEDYITAQILAGQAVKQAAPDKEKKNRMRAESLLKRARKKTSPFHAAYLKKFMPFRFKDAIDADSVRGLTVVKELPEPPEKMIEETPFMRFIRKDAFDNRYKTFFPLMPDWVSFDPESPSDPAVAGKTLPAPSPHEEKAISALYFRPSDPRYIHLTLTKKDNAIPVMVGDILTLSVHTPLHETETTLKGGHMSLDNTGYEIVIQDPAGIIAGDASVAFTPLSKETDRQEAWISRSFLIRAKGSAVIGFVPKPDAGGKTGFPHILRLVAFQGKPPK